MTATIPANGERVMLNLASLTIDTLLRSSVRPQGVDDDHVKTLAAMLAPRQGDEGKAEEDLPQLDPIEVTRLWDEETGEHLDNLNVVAHGFHRHAAYVLAGRTMVPAVVTEGNQEHRLRVAMQGNAPHHKSWTTAERRLSMRGVMATPEYSRKPFGWYEELVGLWTGTARQEWVLLFGEGEREVEGADGVIYTFNVTSPAPRRASARPVAPPVSSEEVEGLTGGETPIALPVMTAGAVPVATRSTATPQPYNGNGNGHAPVALGGYNVTVTPKGDNGYVQIKRPSVVNATQAVEEFNVTVKTADGEWYEWDGQGEPPSVPGSVRSLLIAWLQAQG